MGRVRDNADAAVGSTARFSQEPYLPKGADGMKYAVRWSALLVVIATGVAAAGEGKKEWARLFDGKNLEGWKASENGEACKVRDGKIVLHGERSHLFYVGDVGGHDFEDFVLKAEVLAKPGANSGIYFHTDYQETGWPRKGYEAQINNTHDDHRKTGSLYAIEDVTESPVEDNEWFTYTIRVKGDRIVLKIDGETTVDYVEPEDPERPDNMKGRVLDSGTIAFQAHDPGSEVWIRNVRIRELD
jgi:hypothetical protein